MNEIQGGREVFRERLRTRLARAFAPGVLLLCAGAVSACDRGAQGRDTTHVKVTLSEVAAVYTPEQAAALDLGLTASIKLRLLFDREVSGRRINVDTRERVVTLRGVVETEAEGMRARRIARETHGVARVVDELALRTSRSITELYPIDQHDFNVWLPPCSFWMGLTPAHA